MSHPIAVKTLLSATARELCELHHIAEGLQSVITTSEAPMDDALKTIQQLDYLTQSLEALSEFWLKTETAIPSELSINCDATLNEVRLKDLAASLAGTQLYTTKPDQGVLEEF